MTRKIQKVSLRPFDPEQDIGVLWKWLQAPHVRKWWGDPQEQLNQIQAGVKGGEQCMILADDVAVGFLQWEKTSRSEFDIVGLTEIPEGSIDIDIAIGEENYLGSGIASRALIHLIKNTLQHVEAPMIVMGTSVENQQAQRAFEKAGFVRHQTFDDPLYGKMFLFKFFKNRTPSSES